MYKKHGIFFKNTAWQYGLQIIKNLFTLITLPYLTRVLEPEGYAFYAYVISFMSFAQVFVDFGFNLSGTERIAKARLIKEENHVIGAVTEARLLLRDLFVWDTASFSYIQSIAFIRLDQILPSEEHLYYLQQFFLSFILGGSKVPDSTISIVAQSWFPGMGGGILPFYGFFTSGGRGVRFVQLLLHSGFE